MKHKQFNRKLVLRKQTIANMTGDEMNVLRGGEECTHFRTSCPVEFCPPTWDCTLTYCNTCNTMCPQSCPGTICA
jgi:hypothetical protein